MAARSALSFINYTNRDWTTIRDAVVEHLRKRFPDDFTDITESNLGIAFIEAIAYMYEVLSFSLDRAANENFLASAQQRDSVAKLVGLLGYKMAPATAASVGIRLLDVTDDRSFPILISRGSVVTAGDVIFEVDKEYTISKSGGVLYLNGVVTSPGSLTITANQGSTYSETFTATNTKLQQFKLARSPFIGGSLSLSVDGTPWTQVNSLTLGDPDLPTNGNIFEVSLDGDDVPSIIFGDGTIGNIPTGAIDITYRVGGGQRGNIATGSVSGSVACIEAFNLGSSFSSSIQVTNDTEGSGGSDRETVANAKTFAPAWARTMDRAITLADYEALASGYSDGANGRIAKASVLVGPSDGLSNVVTIYTLAEDIDGGLTAPSPALKESLHRFISDRKVITTYLSPIEDGNIIPIDIDLSVRLSPGFDQPIAIRRINAVINSLFRSSRVRYENKLNSSWIHDYVVAVPGVVSCTINSPSIRAITKDSTNSQLIVQPLFDLPNISASIGKSELTLTSTSISDNSALYVEDYLVGGNIIVSGYKYQILASDAAVGADIRCVIDKVTEISYLNTQVTVNHPRKFRMANTLELLSSESTSGLISRRLNLYYPSAPLSNDVDYSIDSYDSTLNIFTLGRDFARIPAPGDSFIITPDFLAEGTNTLDIGTVNITIESGGA
jgi:hypothetical protein